MSDDANTFVQPILHLAKPYILFLGDIDDPLVAKTAFGLRDWAGEDVVGQWRITDAALSLSLPDLDPMSGRASGGRSLVIGAAPPGGQLPSHWITALVEAAEAGLDIVSGLHTSLQSVPEIVAAAARSGVALHDVRYSHGDIPIGSGDRRSGSRLLTVGTDCAIGKKYTALAIAREMAARGWSVNFRATGQTGIMIAGSGIAIDSVVSDFIAGAAEALSPNAPPEHWDVIEGQGSLFHPSYAAVSLGLLHGSQPDAIVLCHDPLRSTIDDLPQYPMPDVATAIRRNLEAAQLTNPSVRCLGIALNTSKLTDLESDRTMKEYADRYGLVCVDPVRTGVAALVDGLVSA